MKLIQSSASLNPCADVFALAKSVYQQTELLSESLLECWWRVHPEIFWLAYEAGTLCGYISAIPLTKAAFTRSLQSDFDEKRLEPDDILPFQKTYQLYFSSIVVHPDWRSQTISRRLRMAFLKSLIQLYSEGKELQAMSALVVSEKGSRMMQSLGMQVLKPHLAGELYYGVYNQETLENCLADLVTA